MKPNRKAEIQHYVPQLLLRLHLNNPGAKRGSEQVWCFDKKTDRIFSPNIAGILAQSRYYEVEFDGDVMSLEGSLSALEDKVSPILAKVVAARSVARLTGNERAGIAAFIAVQFVRTPSFREHVRSLNQALFDALTRKGISPDQVEGMRVMEPEDVDEFALHALSEAATTYGPHFLSKHWYLIEATPDDPFHLGDHPVVRENELGGAVGLASSGVTIYLPLTPTLCLAMTDAAVIAEIGRQYDRAKRRTGLAKKRSEKRRRRMRVAPAAAEIEELTKLISSQDRHVRAIRNGTPTPYTAEVVMRVNSLQMFYATRWVISSRNDFSLPKLMIEDDDRYRRGAMVEHVEVVGPAEPARQPKPLDN